MNAASLHSRHYLVISLDADFAGVRTTRKPHGNKSFLGRERGFPFEAVLLEPGVPHGNGAQVMALLPGARNEVLSR